MSIANTRLSPRVSVTIRSSPQRGPESATAASHAASPSAGAPNRPAERAMRAVASDHAAARCTRERRAHDAAAQTAAATTGESATTIGASNVITEPAPRMCRRGPARVPTPAARYSAARGRPHRTDDTRDAAPASSRVDRSRGKCSRATRRRSEEHTSELQSQFHLVCRLLLEKKKKLKERLSHSNTTLPRVPPISKLLLPDASPVEDKNVDAATFSYSMYSETFSATSILCKHP